MITSFINGRVRLRDPRFKDEAACATIEETLRSHPCVTSVKANPKTGGVLIEYDPERLDLDQARQALAAIVPEGARWIDDYEAAMGWSQPEKQVDGGAVNINFTLPSPGFRFAGGRRLSPEAAEYLAMTGAFVVCTSSAFLRSKNLHVYSGLTLAGLTVQHIYKFRKRIFSFLRK